ncbi:MAG: biotin transporter BioY [Bdellovibrionales bacterium]|nr:biotin transporter BioY [Bdellovibrionales bacterium]
MRSQALVPNLISLGASAYLEDQRPLHSLRVGLNMVAIAGGAGLIGLLAQVSLPLPFTPVPITGQTFGVLFLSLLWGRNLSFLTLLAYILAGAVGLPWFAQFKSGIHGPSAGYLLGMLVASGLVGFLADQGWVKSFTKAVLAGLLGQVSIFACGLLVLSFYVPNDKLLLMGLYPFLPGALLKLFLAVGLSRSIDWRDFPLVSK